MTQDELDAKFDRLAGSVAAPARVKAYVQAGILAGKVGLPLNFDNWGGYPAARARFLKSAQSMGADLIVISGDSHNAWAYDLAICLNAWCFEQDGSYNMTKGQAMLAGYQSQRPLQQREKEALPILCRGAALRFMLTRLVDWLNVPPGALVKPKDPLEYYRKLRFFEACRNARDYGYTA